MKDAAACDQLSEQVLTELVADKGYHSNAVLTEASELGIRGYISEPDRGRRNWQGKTREEQSTKTAARDAVYGNRRRVTGDRGKSLMKNRGELIERSFAHCYDTGGMRRTHRRCHGNILKRLLIHASGFNLRLILRKTIGYGTSRGLLSRSSRFLSSLLNRICADLRPIGANLAAMIRPPNIRADISQWWTNSKPNHPAERNAARSKKTVISPRAANPASGLVFVPGFRRIGHEHQGFSVTTWQTQCLFTPLTQIMDSDQNHTSWRWI